MPVYKDKERGTYYFSFKRVINGKKYSRTGRGYESKTSATVAELKALEELNNPKTKVNKLTFEALFELYKSYQGTKVKSSTINIYNRLYKCHIEPFFASTMVFSINDRDLFLWKQKIVNKGFNQSFTNSILGLMRKLIDLAIKKEIITNKDLLNELDSVKITKIENHERSVWTLEEIDKFLNTFILSDEKEYLYYLYFLGLANSGMRPNEYRALKVSDIQDDFLIVNKTINSKDDFHDILLPPKNPNSNRKVLMPHYIIELLKEHTKDYKPNDFIFGKDRALRETNIKRYLNKHIKISELHPIVLYGFRHSHATNLIKAGVSIKVVSKRLGHATTSTTMNVYWHLFKDDEKAVLGVLNSQK